MDKGEQIIQLVQKFPGIRYCEVMRETGLKNGVLSHHLWKIQQSGKIIVERSPRVARLYPCGFPEQEAMLIKFLKNPTAKKILIMLMEKDLSFRQIVDKAGKSQGTVSLTIKSLCEKAIVERQFGVNGMTFHLINKSLLDKLIVYQPSFLENSVDHLSDIISSL
jgi:predicted transcriptional regulator